MAAKRPIKKLKRRPARDTWAERHAWWVPLPGGGYMKPRLGNRS